MIKDLRYPLVSSQRVACIVIGTDEVIFFPKIKNHESGVDIHYYDFYRVTASIKNDDKYYILCTTSHSTETGAKYYYFPKDENAIEKWFELFIKPYHLNHQKVLTVSNGSQYKIHYNHFPDNYDVGLSIGFIRKIIKRFDHVEDNWPPLQKEKLTNKFSFISQNL